MFEVVLFKDGVEISRHPLPSGSLNMGRADDNHIVLKADSVSRRHARFLVEGNRIMVEDLGSGNGTFLRGEKLFKRTELKHGDEVSITPFALRVHAPQLAAPAGYGADPGADARTMMMGGMAGGAAAEPQGYAPGMPTGAQLFVNRGMAARASYDLKAGPFTLGRADDRDMVLSDPASSRRHATLHFQGDHYRIIDDGSANGLIINGQPSRDAELRTGDKIVIGETEIEFMWPTGPARSQANALAGNDPYAATNFMPAFNPWEATDRVADHTATGGGAESYGYGMEMAPPPPPKKSPLKPILIAVLLLMVVGIGYKISTGSGTSEQPATVAAVTDPCDAYDLSKGCTDAVDEVCRRCLIKKTRLENGKELFRQKEFSRALQEFQQVLQTIDANHVEARRMAYLTYEFWVITNVDETLQDKAQTSAQKMEKLTAELDKARKAFEAWGGKKYSRETPNATLVAGRNGLTAGLTAANDALKVKADDPEAQKLLAEAEDLKSKLNYKLTEIRRVLEAGTLEALVSEMQTLFDDAMAAKRAGNNKQAIKLLNDLIAKDSNAESELSRKAKSEIVAINAAVRAQATPLYNQGVANFNNGLLLEARANLNKALSIDPTHAEAKAKLRDVEEACTAKGQALYNEAKVQYNVGQYSQAEKLLKQVLEFIPDKSDTYNQRAQDLLGKIQKGR